MSASSYNPHRIAFFFSFNYYICHIVDSNSKKANIFI